MCTGTCCNPSDIKVSIYKCPSCNADILVGIRTCVICGYVQGNGEGMSSTEPAAQSPVEAA
jgi:hypothetical protein